MRYLVFRRVRQHSDAYGDPCVVENCQKSFKRIYASICNGFLQGFSKFNYLVLIQNAANLSLMMIATGISSPRHGNREKCPSIGFGSQNVFFFLVSYCEMLKSGAQNKVKFVILPCFFSINHKLTRKLLGESGSRCRPKKC